MKISRLAVAIFSVCILATLVAFTFTPARHESEEILVATAPGFPPFEFYQDGEIVGMEMDLLREIESRTGLKFKIVPIEFSGIIASLETGKIPMAISGIGFTPERQKIVDFAPEHYNPSLVLIFKTLNPLVMSDLFGKKIGVQTGTVMEMHVKHMQNNGAGMKVLSLDSSPIMIEMIKSGGLDGAIMEDGQGYFYKLNNKDLDYGILDGNGGSKMPGYSIVFAKDFKHKDAISNAINEIKSEGKIGELRDKWFSKSSTNGLTKALFWIVKGLFTTLKYAIISCVIGFILANFIAFMRLSKVRIFKYTAIVYVSIIRGTPLLLQLSFVYFILPHLIGFNISIFAAGIITFSINSSAYVAEVIRGGVESIDVGQFEAIKSLGISKYHGYKDIILPQVFRNIAQSLVNEVISLTKETCIISTIGELDILRRATVVTSEHYVYFMPLCVAGATYYILSLSFEIFADYLNKKLNHGYDTNVKHH